MHTQLKCPPANVLAELIEGQLVEPQLSELTAHLEDCPVCQAHVRTVPPSDLLIESLRGEAMAEDQIARDVPRPLIEKLKQISRSNPSAFGDTPRDVHETRISRPQEEFAFLAPPQQPDELGRLGGYRILKLLGQGGMGAVFLADDPKLQRPVALKVMLPSVALIPLAKERFLREARAAARLKSDHIVTIYEVAEAAGVPYLVMELLEGESLASVFRAGRPLSAERILPIARDIARGLAAAHEAGLVHRDIKPANLWLESRGQEVRVKILDFGLARPGADDAQITQSGTSVGTPAYMSPEQARGDKAVDARADLFSLGCVLYSLCVGEIPFKAETTMGTLLAITLQKPVAPAHRNASIPPPLSALIMQLLEKDAARRPSSAREVIARLEDIEQSLPAGSPRKRLPRGALIAGLLALAISVLAAAIYFWELPDGRVVRIECSDPSIKIAFENGELKVAGAYQSPIKLKPGKVDLKIVRWGAKKDEFTFETNKLIVNKGDKLVLKIEVVEGQVQLVQAGKGVLDSKRLAEAPHVAALSPDADRRAAEWVLRSGGGVEIDDRVVKNIAELPKDRFTLSRVHLPYQQAVTDASLENLAGLQGLKLLNVGGTSVTDEGLIRLKEHHQLKHLCLERLNLTKTGLAHLKDLKELQTLHLGDVPLSDDGLSELLVHQELYELILTSPHLTEQGLTRLKHFKKLTSLTLRGTAATDDTLEHLHDLDLTFLNLCETKLTDKGLARLKHFKGLQELWVEKTAVTAKGLVEFRAALPDCKIAHDLGVSAEGK